MFIFQKMAEKNKVKDTNPPKKRKIHEICACLYICLLCFQYCVVFEKSPKNLNNIVYQMDHI